MLSTSCILIAYPALLPFRSPAATDIVHTYVLPVFQAGCQTKQGAVTGIAVLQPGSFWSDGFSLAFLLLMGGGQVTCLQCCFQGVYVKMEQGLAGLRLQGDLTAAFQGPTSKLERDFL